MVSKGNANEGYRHLAKGEEIFIGIASNDLEAANTDNRSVEEDAFFLGVVGLNLKQDQINDEKRAQSDANE